jgi:hypothetical protein
MRLAPWSLVLALAGSGCDHSLYFRLAAAERVGMAETCDRAVLTMSALYTMFILRSGEASTRTAGCIRLPAAPLRLAEVGPMIGARPQFALAEGDGWEVWVAGYADSACPVREGAAKLLCGKQVFSAPSSGEISIPVECFPEPAAQCTLPP